MTLRNAFGDLALDATVQQLTTAVAALTAVVQEMDNSTVRAQQFTPIPRTMPYARDPSDRMYVNLSGASATLTTTQSWGTNNAYTSWYATGSPSSMDAREVQREASQQTFIHTRTRRWVIT